jgi:hypothetical protein
MVIRWMSMKCVVLEVRMGWMENTLYTVQVDIYIFFSSAKRSYRYWSPISGICNSCRGPKAEHSPQDKGQEQVELCLHTIKWFHGVQNDNISFISHDFIVISGSYTPFF